ncbi:MAG: hypothetical protein M3N82_00415 [Pseudomonadota bacterium]|nr:hypothetical protein [Pseudomonadota bacterium]
MGYAANGFCFDGVDGAAAYACGHDYPLASSVVDASGHVASVLIECTASAGNVLTLQRDVNGAVDGVSSLALTSPACDVSEWHTFYPFSWSASDGQAIAYAVVGAWLAAYAWKVFIQAVATRLGGSRGDEE